MRGFAITGSDGQRTEVESTRYEVTDDGSAHFFVDDVAQAMVLSEDWERIDEFGAPLTSDWPTPKLDHVLTALSQTLSVKYGHYVHKLGSSRKYSHGYFNDLGALTSALLAALGLDPSSDDPAVAVILDTVGEAFDVRKPLERVQPSSFMTQLHCPRCGDTLYEVLGRRRALQCARGEMDLSEVASDLLRDFSASPPPTGADTASPVNWGGAWFCPADGTLMSLEPNQLPECGSCTRVLPARLIYQLIEFQGPHN